MRNRRKFVDTPSGLRSSKREHVRTRWISGIGLLAVIAISAIYGRGAEASDGYSPPSIQIHPARPGWSRIPPPIEANAQALATEYVDRTAYVTSEIVWAPERKAPEENFYSLSWPKALGLGAFVVLLILWIRT